MENKSILQGLELLGGRGYHSEEKAAEKSERLQTSRIRWMEKGGRGKTGKEAELRTPQK